LRLIVVPQLSVGWQQNYSTKTRQAGGANEQSIYSLTYITKMYLMVVTVGKHCGLPKIYEAFLVRRTRNFFSQFSEDFQTD
jgi:hypothetical protein